MHALAREELRQRFATLPGDEQTALHAHAADWLAGRGFVAAAARHALACGQHDKAYELAERGLYEAFVARGQQSAVIDWVARLPAAELDRRPRLLLAAAWVLALSERHDEASQLVERLLSRHGIDDAGRCECALILSGAAVYADDLDRFAALHDPWVADPPLRDPQLWRVHANRTAFRTLIEGEPALARLRRQQAVHVDAGDAPGYVDLWRDVIFGMSYLWEGQVLLAEKVLRPALARAETDLGRRSAFSCGAAAILAATLWDRDQPAEAGALLANRLDVLEKSGLPEAVLLGFQTMARIADLEGAEHRALELLGALEAIGVARRLPRFRVASLAEQVRLHARRFRAETSRDLCARIDALLADPALPQGRLWQRGASLLQAVAAGHAAIAAREWRKAIEPLAPRRRGGAGAQARPPAHRAGRPARPGPRSLRREERRPAARGRRPGAHLRPAAGLRRRPSRARRVVPAGRERRRGQPRRARPARRADARTAAPSEAQRARSTPSMALTPKEREVLELLARNLSNKEVGRAMQVGEETVKWHVKNLFAKLDAGTRKQVVSRARLLGLLEDA
jgi:LuxR family maltose regulon positive regulatory protein